MNNREIRKAIFSHGLRNWQVAKAMGIHEVTLSRWLREELTPDKQERVLEAIRSLCEEAEA